MLIVGAVVLVVLQPRISARVLARRRPGAAELGPLALLALVLAGVYGGYFGAGQGIMLFAVLATAIPDDLQRANGTRALLAGTVNLVSASIFVVVGDPAWGPAGLVVVSSIAGGLLGARLARGLSQDALRAVIVLVGIAAVVQLLVG